jgi:hypothetical protein
MIPKLCFDPYITVKRERRYDSVKGIFRMTVQLHVFKPCSGVRMHRWIASKLFICAGVGVDVERERERIMRLV